MGVPEVLLSGDHARIAAYRFCESVRLTLERRPDLLQKKNFSRAQQRLLQQAGLWPAVQDAMAGKQQ
jgi:tRNA (guanine37-N1)-methyltransferase